MNPSFSILNVKQKAKKLDSFPLLVLTYDPNKLINNLFASVFINNRIYERLLPNFKKAKWRIKMLSLFYDQYLSKIKYSIVLQYTY